MTIPAPSPIAERPPTRLKSASMKEKKLPQKRVSIMLMRILQSARNLGTFNFHNTVKVKILPITIENAIKKIYIGKLVYGTVICAPQLSFSWSA